MATCYTIFASLSKGYMTIHHLDDWREDVCVFKAVHPTRPLPPIVLIPGAFLCVRICRYPSAQTACELERARERRGCSRTWRLFWVRRPTKVGAGVALEQQEPEPEPEQEQGPALLWGALTLLRPQVHSQRSHFPWFCAWLKRWFYTVLSCPLEECWAPPLRLHIATTTASSYSLNSWVSVSSSRTSLSAHV
jgi:hypothetical protein